MDATSGAVPSRHYAIRLLPVFGLAAALVSILLYRQTQVVQVVQTLAGGVMSAAFWQAPAVGLLAQIVDGG